MRNKERVEFLRLARLAVNVGVRRSTFVTGDEWERKHRGIAYDAAKAISFATKVQKESFNWGDTKVALTLGMGATIAAGSDSYPYTLVGWDRTGRTLFLTMDEFTRTDDNGQGGPQEYSYKARNDVPVVKATWNPRRKRYVVEGRAVVSLGERRAYQDPNF